MVRLETRDKKGKSYASIANDMVRKAVFRLTKHQFLILLFFISKIKKDDNPDRWYKIPVQELCDALYINLEDSGSYYQRIKDDLKVLSETEWCKTSQGEYLHSWVQNADFLDIVQVDDEGKATWTGKLELLPDDAPEVKKDEKWSGMIHMRFNAYIAPFLYHLSGNFTLLDLDQVVCFNKPRSIRLYMLLKSYVFKEKLQSNTPIFVKINANELQRVLAVGKQKKDEERPFKYFVRDCLKPTVEEINTKSSEFHVDYTYESNSYDKKNKNIKFIITKAGYTQIENAKNSLESLKRKGQPRI